jgi:membrane-associated protease RseP (regulator of RpoE activity)
VTLLLTTIGVVAFAVGLMASIALHEVGHLVPAKRFGVRVTQYMVGFGRTIWSTRRGDTEYGIKAIPLGGYIRMIGMFPPAAGDDERHLRRASTGPFQSLVEDARHASREEIRPGDEERVFYRKPWWQKLVIMSGGPFMNVVIAVALSSLVLMGWGLVVPQPTVAVVSQCVKPVGDETGCSAADPAAPAAQAGLRPGDRFVSFDGVPVGSWDDVAEAIRDAGSGPAEVVVERDGARLTLTPDLVTSRRPSDTADPTSPLREVGFLGVVPTQARERQSPVGVAAWVGGFTAMTARAVAGIPARMVGVWDAAFGGGERDPNGPVGIVGAGRIGGQIASDEARFGSVGDRIATFLMLLASFNMAIAIFNLVPLLPLDGGHIAGALWEALRRGVARVRGRPDPGYVDVAKALPVAYTVAFLLIGMSALLLYADVVNPVRLQ